MSRLVVCSDRQISREGSESSNASQIGELSELSISDPVGAVIQGQGVVNCELLLFTLWSAKLSVSKNCGLVTIPASRARHFFDLSLQWTATWVEARRSDKPKGTLLRAAFAR